MPTGREQHGYAQALRAAHYLKRRSKPFPQVGIVLGSGLGTLASRLSDPVTIPYSRIPHFPRPAVEGHAGRLHLGGWKDLPVAVLAGRVHLYEGYTPAEVVFAVRVLALAGVRNPGPHLRCGRHCARSGSGQPDGFFRPPEFSRIEPPGRAS